MIEMRKSVKDLSNAFILNKMAFRSQPLLDWWREAHSCLSKERLLMKDWRMARDILFLADKITRDNKLLSKAVSQTKYEMVS